MPPEKDMSSSPLFMMAAMSTGGGSSGGSGSGGGGGSSSLGDVASQVLGSKSQGALMVEVLKSRTVADKLVDQFDLRKLYKVKYRDDARKKLESKTDISEDKKSGVIVIQVTDHDANRAAQMAQAYVAELNTLLASVSTSSARRERIFIEGRLKTVKHDLEVAEQQFSDYASKNTAIDIPEQGKAMVAAAAILQGQLIAAQSELEGLSPMYTPNNVRVRAAQARVDELQKQLQKMGGENASLAVRPAPGAAVSDRDMYPSIRRLPLLGVQWADLYREAKMEETVYELLTGQCELAKIQEAKEIPSVQAFDVGDVPEKPSTLPRLFLMIIGTTFAFGMGAAWILGSSKWQQVDAQDPRKQLVQQVTEDAWIPFVISATRVQKQIAGRLPKWPRNGHTNGSGESQ
jgi:capsule polysaccharide export protein KpsE/RkpR